MIQKSLFKNKNYYLLMGYQLSNGIADKLFQFCIPWFVYDLTGSPVQMTLTFGMSMIPYLLFSILGGALIDCFNRRKILLITSLLSSITLLVFALLFFQDSITIELGTMYALAFLLATYNAFDQPAFDSSVIEYFKEHELVSVNSTIEVILSFCNTVGPLLAGLLIHFAGSKQTILSIAFIYVVSFILIKISKPIQESSLNRKFDDIGELVYENCQLIKEGFAYLLRPGCPILLTILMTFMSNLLFSPQDTLIVFLARDTFKLDSENFATALSIISLIALFSIATLSTTLKKFNIFHIVIATLVIDSLASIGVGLSQTTISLFGFYLIATIMVSVYCIFARSLRQSIVPHSLAGRVASITKSLGYTGAGLGAILSSIFLELFQVETFFIFGGLVMLFVALATYRLQTKFFTRLNPQ